jgi:hypothetical protein
MDKPLFTIGARAKCRDGECGEVIRVVIDPVARAVTHLVIEPHTAKDSADSYCLNLSNPPMTT